MLFSQVAAAQERASSLSTASIEEVSCWLEELGLGQYVKIFSDNLIDGQSLQELTENDLAEDFDMLNKYHRHRFLVKRSEAFEVGAARSSQQVLSDVML